MIGMLIFLFLLVLLWQGIYWIGGDVLHLFRTYTFPAPVGIFQRFLGLMENGSLPKSILYSLGRGIWGFFLAAVIGISLGFLLYHFKSLQKNLKPIVMGIQTLPSVCWVPFSILWFGLSSRAILFVVIMGAAFSIAIAVDGAFRNIPPIYKKAALTMGANRRQLYLSVIFPASLPALISGFRQGWAFAWRALMSGEVMTTSIGLGQTLIAGRDMADINQVMLVMLIIILMGILVDKCVFSSIEKYVLRKRGMENDA